MSDFSIRELSISSGAITIGRSTTVLSQGGIDDVGPKGGTIVGVDWDATIRSVQPYAVEVAAESGTTDNLDTISGLSGTDSCYIFAKSGHTITVRHAVGNIYLVNGDWSGLDTLPLEGPNQSLYLFYRSGNLVELHRSLPPNP